MDSKKRVVYISHPYGGKEENIKEIEEIVRKLYKDDEMYNNFIFVSPVHCYQFLYEEYEDDYYKGLSFCTDLLYHCDLMLLFGEWETSRGCIKEKEICDAEKLPYIEIRTFEQFNNYLEHGLCTDMLSKIKSLV